MSKSPSADNAAHMQQTAQLTAWFKLVRVHDSSMAVDLADVLEAARRIDALACELVRLDPSKPSDADRALSLVTEQRSWLFGEVKPHLEALERAWDDLEERVEALGEPSP